MNNPRSKKICPVCGERYVRSVDDKYGTIYYHRGKRVCGTPQLVRLGDDGDQLDQVEWVDDIDDDLFEVETCIICGCTDDKACDGGCYWVAPFLCSRCAEKMDEFSFAVMKYDLDPCEDQDAGEENP